MCIGVRDEVVGLRRARGQKRVRIGNDGGSGLDLSIGGGNIEATKACKSIFKSRRRGTRPYLKVESIKKGDESLNAAAPEARRPAAVTEERILSIFSRCQGGVEVNGVGYPEMGEGERRCE